MRRTIILLGVLAVCLLLPQTAAAYDFSRADVRDWVQANYWKPFYCDSWNHQCTVMCSCSYRFGAGVPRVWMADNTNDAAFFSTPDLWGSTVDVTSASHSWGFVKIFRDHFYYHPPSGTSFERTGRWRCSVCAVESTAWYGGDITFYHSALSDGSCAADYYHGAVIYARHVESDYDRGSYGTCKVDRTGSPDPYYLGPNFINLSDRYNSSAREQLFVQVNTLVNN